MDEGLRAIGANKECATGESFAFQVRLQLLAQRAVQVREQQEATTPLPASFYLKALKGQLQELRGSLSPQLQQQGMWSEAFTEDKVQYSRLLQFNRPKIADM